MMHTYSVEPHIALWLQRRATEEHGTMTFDGRPLPKGSAIEKKCQGLLQLGKATGKVLLQEPNLQLYQNTSGYTLYGEYIDTDESQRRLGFKAYISGAYNIHQAIHHIILASEEFDRTCHPIDMDKLESAASFYTTRQCLLVLGVTKVISLAMMLLLCRSCKRNNKSIED